MKLNHVWKLLIPLAIVLALTGIWALKNMGSLEASNLPKKPETSETTDAEIQESANAETPESANAETSRSTNAETSKSTNAETSKSTNADTSKSANAETSESTNADTSKSANAENAEGSENTESTAGSNRTANTESPAGTNRTNTQSTAEAESPADAENPDFALEAETLDLEQLTSYELPIVIDFGADWCGPCLKFAPIFESVYDRMLGSAILKYVDVDKSGDLADKYPIRVIPTQVFFLADGTPYVPSEKISVKFLTYNDKTTGKRQFTVHEGPLTEEELNAILADMGVEQ